MASIYVSYKSEERPFVEKVVHLLGAAGHRIFVDFELPHGVEFRSHMQTWLKEADAFVVFASKQTDASPFQNAEIGAARLCSTFLDGKMIIPILIDRVPFPRNLEVLDVQVHPERDVERIADDILQAINRDNQRIKLFISHAHKDADLAERLVDVISTGMEVPQGAIRCTSAPGYKLDLGTNPDVLRRELGSAGCVITLVSPNSLASQWVLFELGAAWANATLAIPLLVGGLKSSDIPGPLRGAAGDDIKDPLVLDQLLSQLAAKLAWRRRNDLPSQKKLQDLARYAARKKFPKLPA